MNFVFVAGFWLNIAQAIYLQDTPAHNNIFGTLVGPECSITYPSMGYQGHGTNTFDYEGTCVELIAKAKGK